MMGEAGILGGHKGTVSRDVVMTLEEWQAMKAQWQADAAANRGPRPRRRRPERPPLGAQTDLFDDGPTLRQLSRTEPKPMKAEPDAFDESFAEEDGWEQGDPPRNAGEDEGRRRSGRRFESGVRG